MNYKKRYKKAARAEEQFRIAYVQAIRERDEARETNRSLQRRVQQAESKNAASPMFHRMMENVLKENRKNISRAQILEMLLRGRQRKLAEAEKQIVNLRYLINQGGGQ